jgi:hypothetical protein
VEKEIDYLRAWFWERDGGRRWMERREGERRTADGEGWAEREGRKGRGRERRKDGGRGMGGERGQEGKREREKEG